MSTAGPLRAFIPRASISSSTSTISNNCPSPSQCLNKTQVRHATLIRRPKRPYTFTQLVTLSDGSSFTHRTTSPVPVYVSVKDTRNSQIWNPSNQKLLSAESDEAGKLRRFREKFGRGWDNKAANVEKKKEKDGERSEGFEVDGGPASGRLRKDEEREEDDNLMDLISGFGNETQKNADVNNSGDSTDKSGKGKGGES